MKESIKNNKGFSLVELIVVVLIIGILGVSLAPNIMKWVNTARTNVDKSNRAAIESSVNAAVAEFLSVAGNKISADVTFTVDGGDGVKNWNTGSDWEDGQDTSLKNSISDVFNGKYPTTQEVTGGFSVTISTTGTVTVTYSGSDT